MPVIIPDCTGHSVHNYDKSVNRDVYGEQPGK